jgi:RHS repeat-associated protein
MDIVQEIEGGLPTVNYIRTLNIDEPLARIESDGTLRYYHTDALGSVVALSDENGVVKTTYTYDPFGNTFVSGEASDNPFQYTGRENDQPVLSGVEGGLYYYRFRYYSPELQRFISEDPIGLAGGINFYSYVGNNPVNWVDPYGLWKFSFGVGGTAGIIDFNWNTLNPTQTNISFVTPQLGGGINLCFNADEPQDNCGNDFPSYDQPLEEQPLTYSVGWRYAGVSFTDNFGSFCVNIGVAWGPLPINVGLPLSPYSHDE